MYATSAAITTPTTQPIYRDGMNPSFYHWDYQLRSKSFI